MNILPALHHSHDYNGCVDSSPASKSDWRSSLHRGCLNKDTNDKYRLYSQMRALPSRNIPDANASIRRKNSLRRSTLKHDADSHYDDESEIEATKAALSSVFLEDSTRPPEDSDEVMPELFTVDDFFKYLWSDNWKKEICLRVVGGKLLKLLLTALYDLERCQKLHSHIIRANLNNRRKFVAKDVESLRESVSFKKGSSVFSQKRSSSVVRSKKGRRRKRSKNANNHESADAPNTSRVTNCNTPDEFVFAKARENSMQFWKPQDKLSCESMVIQLIIYEKTEASNVIYTKSDKINSDSQSSAQRPLSQDVLHPAYSQVKQNMNHVRLPLNEQIDVKEKIATLTSELGKMLKITTNRFGIDSVRASPHYLKLLEKFQHEDYSPDVNTKTDKGLDRSYSEIITDNVWFHSTPPTRCEDGTEIAHSCSKIDDENPNLSPIDDTNTLAFKKLNLSRKEMYITSLYVPRTVNRVPTEVKLQHAKEIKHNIPGRNMENSTAFKFTGASNRFTQVPLLKQNMHKPYYSQDSRIANEMQVKDGKVSDSLWERYIREQEQIEMEVALNNDLVIRRLDRPRNTSRIRARSSSFSRKQKAKKAQGKTIVDRLSITGGRGALPNISNGDTPTQLNSRETSAQVSRKQSPNRVGKKTPLSREMTSEKQQQDTEMLPDETQLAMNVNSNSIVHLPRKRIISKRYLYVHEFQEPCIRSPVPPSEYQKRRSYQIMDQTPYVINAPEDGSSDLRSSEKSCSLFDKSQRRIYTVTDKIEDDNWSHIGLNPQDSKDQVVKPRQSGPGCYQCPCAECHLLREALADLKPDTELLAPGYSCRLGKLRRDFAFLQPKDEAAPKEVKQNEIVSHFVTMDLKQVCDHLMRLIDNVTFRKEILTSSFGQTYVTVVFSKEKASTI